MVFGLFPPTSNISSFLGYRYGYVTEKEKNEKSDKISDFRRVCYEGEFYFAEPIALFRSPYKAAYCRPLSA